MDRRMRGCVNEATRLCRADPDTLSECVLQVGNQVVDVLDANRDSDETICDSQSQPLLRGHGRMRHRCAMRDQRLDSSQTLSERAELHTLEKSLCLVQAAEIESDHAAEAGHLPLRQFMTRMIR